MEAQSLHLYSSPLQLLRHPKSQSFQSLTASSALVFPLNTQSFRWTSLRINYSFSDSRSVLKARNKLPIFAVDCRSSSIAAEEDTKLKVENRNKRIIKLAKGFRGRPKTGIRIAGQKVLKALQYSHRDRRNKKRDMRSLWILRINAGSHQHGVNYGKLLHGLMQENIRLNRKVLYELAMREPDSFKALVDISKSSFPLNKNVIVPPKEVHQIPEVTTTLMKNMFDTWPFSFQ